MFIRLQEKIGKINTWAIVIDKTKFDPSGNCEDIFNKSWEFSIQRIERHTTKSGEPAVIIPDRGRDDDIRIMFRRMRRYSLVQSYYEEETTLSRPATFIVEDPNFRVVRMQCTSPPVQYRTNVL